MEHPNLPSCPPTGRVLQVMLSSLQSGTFKISRQLNPPPTEQQLTVLPPYREHPNLPNYPPIGQQSPWGRRACSALPGASPSGSSPACAACGSSPSTLPWTPACPCRSAPCPVPVHNRTGLLLLVDSIQGGKGTSQIYSMSSVEFTPNKDVLFYLRSARCPSLWNACRFCCRTQSTRTLPEMMFHRRDNHLRKSSVLLQS